MPRHSLHWRAPGRVAAACMAAGIWLTACVSLPVDIPREESHALKETADTRLGRALGPLAGAHGGLSGAVPLASGIDAFVARLALAEGADRSLDVQYYIWRNDVTGRLLLDHLWRAADRGVRVRLLIDDLGTAADDARLLLLDQHPGMEVRLFNPIAMRNARLIGSVADFGRINRRMHNKSFIADTQAAIVGGRNIGDEYFEARSDLDFADLDVLAVGPVVQQVSDSFDLYWNSPAAIPITALTSKRSSQEEMNRGRVTLAEYGESQRASAYAEALRNSALVMQLQAGSLAFFWCEAMALYDDPAKITQAPEDQATHLLPRLGKITDSTHSEFLVVSPYFIPGNAGVEYLQRMRARGVRVVVLTNSLAATDVAAVHAGYSRYRRALLESGVEIYEVKSTARRSDGNAKRPASSAGMGGSSQASLHAKTYAFDRRTLFIGSLNLDPRSTMLNTEIGLVLESPELASQATTKLMEALSETTYRLELVPAQTPGGSSRHIEWVELENGQEIRHKSEPNAGIWRRFGVWFMSWLPIESQL